MTVYFLVDKNNLVANMAEYPEGMVPSDVSSNWLSTEQTATAIGGKVYNSSDQTFSDPTGDLVGVEPINQFP
tara:strand:+ start:279 stop:494 length:216 start_codon:yes stop_codon:yes gene_type:complete